MKAYGISGPELEFFNSYLRNKVQYCINGCTSDLEKLVVVFLKALSLDP